MIRNFSFAALFIVCLLLTVGPDASAAVPPHISLQGKLQRADGSALQGIRVWRVTFYDAASSGTQLGSVLSGTVALSAAGRYSIEVEPPVEVLNESNVFYQLAIDSAAAPDDSIDAADVFPTLVRVNSVPYALKAGQVDGLSAGDFWKLGGNAGSDPMAQWLGTSDNTAFELHTGGQRALLVEAPTTTTAGANIVFGMPDNFIDPDAISSTIAGGGSGDLPGGYGGANRILGAYGFIGGGAGNVAGLPTFFFLDPLSGIGAFVGGGLNNLALAGGSTVSGGLGNSAQDSNATVGGGIGNIASGANSFVGGGNANQASAPLAVVAGGSGNSASSSGAAVGGGSGNVASNSFASVGGGSDNIASGQYAAIGGGSDNISSGTFGVVPGGQLNSAKGNNSLAAGTRAKANHAGAFVWADTTPADFASMADNQYLIRAAGGVGINKNNPTSNTLDVNGDIKFSGTIAGKVVRSDVAGGQRIISGVVSGAGSIVSGSGFSVIKNGTGSYTISYTASFSALPATTAMASGVNLTAQDVGSAPGGITITIFNTAGTLTDPTLFHFISVGP